MCVRVCVRVCVHVCVRARVCVVVGQNQSNLGSSLWFSILGHLPLSLASGLGMSSCQATFITTQSQMLSSFRRILAFLGQAFRLVKIHTKKENALPCWESSVPSSSTAWRPGCSPSWALVLKAGRRDPSPG